MWQELSYTKHGGEEDAVILHPGEIFVELYRRSTKRSEVVVNIYRGDEPILTNTSVPASLVVRVVGPEPGQATALQLNFAEYWGVVRGLSQGKRQHGGEEEQQQGGSHGGEDGANRR